MKRVQFVTLLFMLKSVCAVVRKSCVNILGPQTTVRVQCIRWRWRTALCVFVDFFSNDLCFVPQCAYYH